ncbi:hypothetical protein [Mycobacterium sp.]|uniref:hypothetical protein n=1 Tax=Mycobacterium sp. TaxID=1785 RepID=UPI00260D1254|nr:hypothetical protein [Mycobacterium sp.]
MPRRNDLLLRATFEGEGPVAAAFTRTERAAQDATIREVRRLGRVLEDTYREHAPEDSGRVRGSIRAAPFFNDPSQPRTSIYAYARDPKNGYDYLPVTRFGHRVLAIVPKVKRALTVHADGRDLAGDGPYFLAPVVSGYHPFTDWVDDAEQQAVAETADSTRRLGREIVLA